MKLEVRRADRGDPGRVPGRPCVGARARRRRGARGRRPDGRAIVGRASGSNLRCQSDAHRLRRRAVVPSSSSALAVAPPRPHTRISRGALVRGKSLVVRDGGKHDDSWARSRARRGPGGGGAGRLEGFSTLTSDVSSGGRAISSGRYQPLSGPLCAVPRRTFGTCAGGAAAGTHGCGQRRSVDISPAEGLTRHWRSRKQ